MYSKGSAQGLAVAKMLEMQVKVRQALARNAILLTALELQERRDMYCLPSRIEGGSLIRGGRRLK